MNPQNFINPEDTLDAYLDGTLDEPQRAAFELHIEQDPRLKQQIETQKRIDASLRRCYPVPDVDALLDRARAETESSAVSANRLQRIGRMAAMIVVGVSLVLAVQWAMTPGKPAYQGGNYAVIGLEPAYQQLIADGFTPAWRCETDEEFAQTYGYQIGVPVVLTELPAGTEALGLSYIPAISFDTIALLATVDGQQVVVFGDHVRATSEDTPKLTDTSLNLFQRRIGDLVLYEITPLDTPRVLDHFLLIDSLPAQEPGSLP